MTLRQDIADTVQKIGRGELSGLKPHPFRNGGESTGARLPHSEGQVYVSFDVRASQGSSFAATDRGAVRILVNQYGFAYLTTTHHRGFERISLKPNFDIKGEFD